MKISSAKKKGRRILLELREAILRAFPELCFEDIVIMPTSVGGDDLKLSPAARRVFPFSVEGKNKENLGIFAAIEQAKSNANGRPPAVVFRRNHTEAWAAVPLTILINLLQRVQGRLTDSQEQPKDKGKYRDD